MTGKGILEALSFVDEAYIEEAENGAICSAAKSYVSILLPLAACFCLVLLGFFPKAQTESAPAENLSDEAMQETAKDAVIYDRTENAMVAESDISLEDGPAEVSCLILQIEKWTEEGFSAVVAEAVDTDVFPVGTVLNVELLDTICIETVIGEHRKVERRVPTDADFPAGSVIRVRFVSVSDDHTTIRIESISMGGE